VSNITDYGIFVELKPGVEGLLHISEMTWLKQPPHPSEAFKEADTIEVMVQAVDYQQRRISLSRKSLVPNPWIFFKERYPPGSHVFGRVCSVMDYWSGMKILIQFGSFRG